MLQSSKNQLISISAKDQHRFGSVISKFHDFTCEFDRRYEVLSIWSSNGAVSFQARTRLIGKHLLAVLGRETWSVLRAVIRRVWRRRLAGSFQLPVPLHHKPHWFDVTVSSLSQSSAAPRIGLLRVQDITNQHFLEQRLHDSKLMLEHAEEIADMGTWEYDLVTGAVIWSKQQSRLHGLDQTGPPANVDDLWPVLNFKNPEKLRKDFESAIRARRPFRFSEPYTLPDGSVRVLDGVGAPVSDATGKVARVVGVTRDVTLLARTQANLRWLSHQLLTIRSEEQRRMSRELHETTSQTLAALKMTLAQIGRSVPRHNNKVQKLVRTSATLASAAVREVRFVSSFLHPPMLEETGLVAALGSYAKLFEERGGVPVQVHIAGDFGRLEKSLELTIFRIVQESLTNVHRHARATSASIRIERSASTVMVEIKDDGIGVFHVLPGNPAQVPLGVGIAGIRERVGQLHGQFDILSTPGAGTTIRAVLPVTSKETQNDLKAHVERTRRSQTLPHPGRRRSPHRSQRNSRAARN